MTKVVCWNMDYKRDSWRKLVQMDADVALLQEPCKVPPDVADRVEIEPPDHWSDWDSCLPKPARAHRRPRVAKLSDRVKVDWFKPVPLLERYPRIRSPSATSIPSPPPGSPRLTAIRSRSSPYRCTAHWKSPHPSTGREKNDPQADASAHRIISDLSVFVPPRDRLPHRILAAGDLNIDCGIDCDWRLHDDKLPLWEPRRAVRMGPHGSARFRVPGAAVSERTASGSHPHAPACGDEERAHATRPPRLAQGRPATARSRLRLSSRIPPDHRDARLNGVEKEEWGRAITPGCG